MRVLLTGASGQLGAYLLKHLREELVEVMAWSGRRAGGLFGIQLMPVDLADGAQVRAAFEKARPDVVIHAAAMSAIAEAVANPQRAFTVNAGGTCLLAELAARRNARLIYISTDLVFDGETSPCRETTAPRPLSIYGQSKLAGEPAVLDQGGLVVRVSLLFGPSLIGRPTFFDQQLAALGEGKSMRLFDDEWRTPLDLPSAAEGIWQAAKSPARGLLHFGGPERLSRLQIGQRIAAGAGLDATLLEPVSRLTVGGEPRPRDTALDDARLLALLPQLRRPSCDEAVKQFLTGAR